MGTKPRQSTQPQKRKNARIVSFDDAKRTSARKPSTGANTQALTQPLSGKSASVPCSTASRRLTQGSGSAKSGPAADIPSKGTPKATVRKRIEERKRARTKAKAEKKFDAAYGGDSGSKQGPGSQGGKGSQGQQDQAGPRPAVYEGKMGASHKKSTKLQAKAAGNAVMNAASGIKAPKVKLSKLPRGLVRAFAGVAVVALFAVALYGPAQNYYQQMRETDRLQAEYAAVAARSNTLQSTIDSLSSEEGIEDKAHTDLGYVKKGEQAGTVKGANIVDKTEFSSNVAPGSIPAPETWYSPFLDVVFGYSS